MKRNENSCRLPDHWTKSRWRLRNLFSAHWSFLVWVGACLATWFLWKAHPHLSASPVYGLVEANPAMIGPVETARIKAVKVAEGDNVRKGDVLIEMDTSLIDHGVTADLVDTVSIESAFGDTHQDVLQAISQRLDAIARAKAELAAAVLEWEREKGELASLKAEQARRKELHDKKLLDPVSATELLPQIGALEGAAAAYPELIRGHQATLDEAEKYYKDIVVWLGQLPGESVSDAIRRRLQQDSMEILLTDAKVQARAVRESYVLRAERDAVVAAIYRRAGEVVPAGEPILRLVSADIECVRAYVPEDAARNFVAGQEVNISPVFGGGGIVLKGRVETVDSEVRVNHLSISVSGQQIPERTRQAIVRVEPNTVLVAGEQVVVATDNPVAGSLRRFLSSAMPRRWKGG